jgi:hypothetical protein
LARAVFEASVGFLEGVEEGGVSLEKSSYYWSRSEEKKLIDL